MKAADPTAPPSIEKTLRQLFLTIFLRGQSGRGLAKDKTPTAVVKRLWGFLLIYGLLGATTLFLSGQSTFVIAVSNHGLTFLMLGMFVASSAGDALFNKDE